MRVPFGLSFLNRIDGFGQMVKVQGFRGLGARGFGLL